MRFSITVILLLTAGTAIWAFQQPEALSSRRTLNEFPSSLGKWRTVGTNQIDAKSMAVLKVDDYLMRTYSTGDGETVGLYIGYFKTQKQGKSIHSPRLCLPGSGWTRIDHREIRFPADSQTSKKASINVDLMAKGAERDLFVWWYQGRGRVYANEYLNVIYLIWDGFTRQRTDGALVRVNGKVRGSVEETLEEQLEFIKALALHMPSFIPK